MYDVQPTDEPGWTSPPFAALRRDNRRRTRRGARHRGTGRGQLQGLARLFPAGAGVCPPGLRPACGHRFLVDGEEELGSPNLPFVMSERRADLAAEAAFDMDLTAIALEPRVLVGDEPVSMLDASVRGEILKL